MDADAPAWVIEELGEHDRAEFSCGHASLDDFLKRFAGQNQRSGFSSTFVAVVPGEKSVRGYYSLAAGSISPDLLTEAQKRRLPTYPVPVAHLGRLAVDKSVQGRGLGAYLLLDALARAERVRHELGVYAVEVVAIDQAARSFYLRLGFLELLDDPHHLMISLDTVRKLGLA